MRYPATDGTEVPMLLVHGEATAIDDRTPTLLTGYGGFNLTETPAWSPFVAAWCEARGQVAGPGIRAAGEDGEARHPGGVAGRTPHVFPHFAAAPDRLLRQGGTPRERRPPRGGSH